MSVSHWSRCRPVFEILQGSFASMRSHQVEAVAADTRAGYSVVRPTAPVSGAAPSQRHKSSGRLRIFRGGRAIGAGTQERVRTFDFLANPTNHGPAYAAVNLRSVSPGQDA